MPFTFSHPAIILPFNFFKKRWISLTGLIAGSISPDFEYFLRMIDYSVYSHTWRGLFWFDLPVAFILTFIYHGIVKKPMTDHLPGPLKRRLWRYRDFNWQSSLSKKWIIVLLCILLGAFSHLLWDTFTHETIHMAARIPSINDILHINNHHKLTYFLFWDLSSVIGGVFIIFSIWQLPVFKGAIKKNNALLYWGFILMATCIVFGFWLYVSDDPSFPNCTVASVASFQLALVFISFVYKYFPNGIRAPQYFNK